MSDAALATVPVLACAALLIAAGAIKVKDPRALGDSISVTVPALAHRRWLRVAVRIVGVLELTVGAGTVVTLQTHSVSDVLAATIIAVIMGIFTAYTCIAVYRGATCGCFGKAFAAATAGPAEITRNVILTSGATLAAARASSAGGLRGIDGQVLLLTAGYLVLVALLTLGVGYVAAGRIAARHDASNEHSRVPVQIPLPRGDEPFAVDAKLRTGSTRRQLLRTAALGAAGYASLAIITKDQALAAGEPALLRGPLEQATVERVLVGGERTTLVNELKQKSSVWESELRQHRSTPRWPDATASLFTVTLADLVVQWRTLAVPTSTGGVLAYSPEMGDGGRILTQWSTTEGVVWQGSSAIGTNCTGCFLAFAGAVTGCSGTAIGCPACLSGGLPACLSCGLGAVSCALGGIGIAGSCPSACTSPGGYETCVAIHQAFCQVPVSSNCRPVSCIICGCPYGCCLTCNSGCGGVYGGPMCFDEVATLDTSHCCAAGCCCPESYGFSQQQLSSQHVNEMTQRIDALTQALTDAMRAASH